MFPIFTTGIFKTSSALRILYTYIPKQKLGEKNQPYEICEDHLFRIIIKPTNLTVTDKFVKKIVI